MQKGLGNMFISAAILLGFFMIVACMGWMKKAGCTIGSYGLQYGVYRRIGERQ